jgi:PAS domain-containing protein
VQTFVCATRDVTERKQMEEDLARSEARFRAALDGSFDAFFVLDAVRGDDGQLIDFVYAELNPRAESLLARHRSSLIGQTADRSLPDDSSGESREARIGGRLSRAARGRGRGDSSWRNRTLGPPSDHSTRRRRRRHVS